MFSKLDISTQLISEVYIGDKEYTIDMAFDNILRFIRLLGDEKITDANKIKIGIEILLDEKLDYDFETLIKIFKQLIAIIFDTDTEEAKEDVVYDLAGEPLPAEFQKKQKEHYSLTEDAQYIFSSFKHYYGIDLFEEQGELDWRKFKAYLNDLGSDTKFSEVVKIRMMEIPADATEAEKNDIRKLKAAYALEGSQNDIENGALDLAQKQIIAQKMYEEMMRKEEENE
ncbi:Gp15 family bacteriophage protein [Listeria booriae]|uniref:Gp15 family bacteriophage protein n=1 Tax=Listeria booriae TaxID=1552123 RepID=UPI00162425D3|nr:Gp15 family bacteriophage protein [Listeria booriae]MBC1982772.1 hypothetical protein [Listeria booriae]